MTKNMTSGVSRRNFLGALGAAGAGLVAVATASAAPALAEDNLSGKKGILFDATKCVGCHYCEAACKKANGLDCDVAIDLKALANGAVPSGLLSSDVLFGKDRPQAVTEDDRDGSRWLRVTRTTVTDGESKSELNMRHACTHCGLCASVCPSGAMKKRADGIVDVDRELCIGCGYCYQACPFDIPRYPAEGDRAVTKCTGCAGRVDAGQQPACVDICPAGALAFGDRASVAASGEARAAEVGGHLYGKEELGGIGVMTVTAHSNADSGLPEVPKN